MRFVIALFFLLGLSTVAKADVHVVINRATQQVTATIDGKVHVWPTSTGKRDSWTPPGTYSVQSMDADHYSSLYDDAPMPHSIFFNGNVALHGTMAVGMLGTRDSHGCARLHPRNAKTLFDAVVRNGRRATIQVL